MASIFGIRHLQCLLVFFSITVGFLLRINLSVGIVAMTNKNTTNPDFPEYSWNMKTRSTVLSSFFWGYVITQIPGGSLAYYFGGKVTLLWSMFICSLLGIITPFSTAMGDWQLLCALRVAQGLCQGVIYPAVHTIFSKWAPVEERGILSLLTYSGAQFGTVVTLGTSGVLASSCLGWPSLFYMAGIAGLLWCIAFLVWGADTPDNYRTISAEEQQLIANSLGASARKFEVGEKKLSTPWRQMLTSPAFLVVILTHTTHNWGFWTLLTQIPSYIHSVHGQDIKNNALLSALPYLAMLLMCIFFSSVAAYLNRHPYMSLQTSRKVFNTIAHWTPAVTLVGLGYTDADHTVWAIVILTVTVGITAAVYMGFHVNHIDLSPNFAGVLMGITNCMANFMGILAPLFVGFIVVDEKDARQWRTVFFVASGVYFVGNLMFIIFAKGDVQPWNDLKKDDAQKDS